MPRRPPIDDRLGASRDKRTTPLHESFLKFARILARDAAENRFEDLIQAQKHGKLRSKPESDLREP